MRRHKRTLALAFPFLRRGLPRCSEHGPKPDDKPAAPLTVNPDALSWLWKRGDVTSSPTGVVLQSGVQADNGKVVITYTVSTSTPAPTTTPAPVSAGMTAPRYQLDDTIYGDHLYAISTAERDQVVANDGYAYEGAAADVSTTASASCRGSSTALRRGATCRRIELVGDASQPRRPHRTWCTTGGSIRG